MHRTSGFSCTAALSRNCVSSLALLARDCAEERLQTCHGSERILSYLMNPVIQSLTATSADKPTCCLPFLKFHLPGTLRRSVNTIVRSVTQNKTQSNLKCRRDMWPHSGMAGPTVYVLYTRKEMILKSHGMIIHKSTEGRRIYCDIF